MRRCQRQLFFGHVMASHGARNPERREAYILKQLRNLRAWQGSVVHQVLRTHFVSALRESRPFDRVTLTAAAQDLARRQLAFSAAKRYREPGQTKRAAGEEYCALYEHEHGLEVSPEALAEVYANLARCFEHLGGQVEFLDHLYDGSQHLAEQQLSFRLNGVVVTVVPDLVFSGAAGQSTVVDWKVAENETSDYSWQLLIYALAVARYGRRPAVQGEAIELYEANLLKNEIRHRHVSGEQLDEAEDFTYRSMVELEALIGDRKFQEQDLDEFEVAKRPQTCFHCNFGRLCVRRLEAATRLGEAQLVQGRLL